MNEGRFTTKHLAVVGLGLMGGSMAMALRDRADFITGMDLNPASCDYALENGIIDKATTDLFDAVSEADTVILAAPVRIIAEMLNRRIGSYLRSNTLLIDLGSTKYDICEAMGKLPVGINAIGGHPMTGKERSGIEEAEAGLYVNCPFVLCSTRRTTPATRVRALDFVRALQANPIEMDAERHDKIVAGISHLPYILSACMVATIAREAGKDDAFWELAAGGFRDTSRLAASDIRMMGDIISTNTRAIATLLAQFRVQLATLETMLISGDHEQLIESLLPVREARLNWAETYEQKRRNGQTHSETGKVAIGDGQRSGG